MVITAIVIMGAHGYDHCIQSTVSRQSTASDHDHEADDEPHMQITCVSHGYTEAALGSFFGGLSL